MDTKQQRTEAEFDGLLLLLAATPRPGFERFFEELTRREVERLMPVPLGIPVSNVEDEDGDGEG